MEKEFPDFRFLDFRVLKHYYSGMLKMMRSGGFSLMMVTVLFFTTPALAVEDQVSVASVAPEVSPLFPASDWTRETTYADKISHKLGFGFLNLTAGWTAFFYEPAKDANFFAGLGKGVLYFATNTVGGLLHAGTFPIPVDIPLPHGGISYEYSR